MICTQSLGETKKPPLKGKHSSRSILIAENSVRFFHTNGKGPWKLKERAHSICFPPIFLSPSVPFRGKLIMISRVENRDFLVQIICLRAWNFPGTKLRMSSIKMWYVLCRLFLLTAFTFYWHALDRWKINLPSNTQSRSYSTLFVIRTQHRAKILFRDLYLQKYELTGNHYVKFVHVNTTPQTRF